MVTVVFSLTGSMTCYDIYIIYSFIKKKYELDGLVLEFYQISWNGNLAIPVNVLMASFAAGLNQSPYGPTFLWNYTELEACMVTLITRTFHRKYDFCAIWLLGLWYITS